MSAEAIFALVGVTIVVLTLVFILLKFIVRRVPKKHIKPQKFQLKWKELQAYCKDKATWPQALTAADQLLDKALIKRRIKGRNIGERLVSAQHQLTDNDAVWFGHKLCRKLQDDPNLKLKEKDVKDALVGIRQALRDLGAL